MRKLVSPDHTLYIVSDQSALEALMKRLGLGYQQKGNLRQLCGYDEGGAGQSSGGWTLLQFVRWLQRDGVDVHIPAIGSAPQIRKNVAGLAAVTTSDDVVKNLLNGKRKTWPDGWSCLPKGTMPDGADALESGSSIDGLPVGGAQVGGAQVGGAQVGAVGRADPDYAALFPEALPSTGGFLPMLPPLQMQALLSRQSAAATMMLRQQRAAMGQQVGFR